MRGLKSKIVVITGGLGDLGYATAIRMAEEGCRVALFDIKPDSNSKATAIGALFKTVDISNEFAVERACAAVEKEMGPAWPLGDYSSATSDRTRCRS